MADIPPDWIPEDPDGHRWVRPESPACPNCKCCSDQLCTTAKQDDSMCFFLVGGRPGVMDVSDCPCAPLVPPGVDRG
ncbi:hypothetical protein [Amycolatopsis vancoresmycina]|uniref:Uncharacterized protein n=1 Tax=Amycolatopsis vancoresmycina DSM 44592 TaxID=1292037 RepID=R1HTK4_9PSEU|nr:hypothetical protein [Amycolatopsis vancoresmycina]EOD66875.1 hypothetical protein H480_19168 [Amycolatopsis vancoresmycina DSM 44592]